VGGPAAQVLSTSGPVKVLWSGDRPLTISSDGRYVVDDVAEAIEVGTGRRTSLAPTLTAALTRGAPTSAARWPLVGAPVVAGFWHDARTVEVTRSGAPLAVCTVPQGPCRSGTA
jgi:hypothetical protein